MVVSDIGNGMAIVRGGHGLALLEARDIVATLQAARIRHSAAQMAVLADPVRFHQ